MPRRARIDYPGLTHHVMGRTFVGTVLFRDDEDRNVFPALLSRHLGKGGFQCYAWALMDTHYHLLVHTSQSPLWTLMKALNNGYARLYNTKYRRRGALPADRYKSIATQDQNYLEQILQYVHLNPVRAGMCRSIQELNSCPLDGPQRAHGFNLASFPEHGGRFEEVRQEHNHGAKALLRVHRTGADRSG